MRRRLSSHGETGRSGQLVAPESDLCELRSTVNHLPSDPQPRLFLGVARPGHLVTGPTVCLKTSASRYREAVRCTRLVFRLTSRTVVGC